MKKILLAVMLLTTVGFGDVKKDIKACDKYAEMKKNGH